MVLSLVFGLFWLIIFLWKKELRGEILTTSLIFSVMGFSEIIFKEYWSPKSVFGLIESIGFGFEDILFCFFLGGISATIWEVLFFKKERHLKQRIKNHHILSAGCIMVLLMLILEKIFPMYTIFTSCIFMIFVVFMGCFRYRKDLILYLLESGVVFMLFYILVLKIVFAPVEYFSKFYHFEYLTNFQIIGIPLEEYMFGFAFGVLGSFIYKFIYDKEIISRK
jgi:hypothetical protein